jgi:hypothetical protein
MASPYFSSDNTELRLDNAPIRGNFRRPPKVTEELRAFARFMANGKFRYGSIYKFGDGSPLEDLSQGKLDKVVYGNRTAQLPDINRFKKEAYIVYDDSALELERVHDILKIKAGLSDPYIEDSMKVNLVTMMLPSYKFDLFNWTTTGSIEGTEIRIFAYTYPHFSHYPLDKTMEQNVKSMVRLNMLTVCYEALRQEKPLPFIVNPPGAFVSRLNYSEKEKVAQMISHAVSDILNDEQLQEITNKFISDWVLLSPHPPFWSSTSRTPGNVHLVWADVCDIAVELWKAHGVLCPIPMMGDPLGSVGNRALGNHSNKALDEYLFRTCGGIHGLVGSIRYNPDMSVFPLSRILEDLEESPTSREV